MDRSREMDVERSSLCNWVVNFLLEENYLLTAFELLHELEEDGRHDQAIRLKEYFSNTSMFPPDQISRLNALKVADPQSLLEDKEALEEKLAISEYELRLAKEDLLRLKDELQKNLQSSSEASTGIPSTSLTDETGGKLGKKNSIDLGPLKDAERKDLNCAVKEYLLLAGYRLTAMTFYEEVIDQNLDVSLNTSASISDALRRYYYQYLSSTDEAAEEKMNLLREREALVKENERLSQEKESLQKNKDLIDGQLIILSKSLEAAQKDLKEREILIQDLKKSLELQRKEINDCRSEITSLKMHIEGFRAGRGWAGAEVEQDQTLHIDIHKEEIKSVQQETENLRVKNSVASFSTGSVTSVNGDKENKENNASEGLSSNPDASEVGYKTHQEKPVEPDNLSTELLSSSCNGDISMEDKEFTTELNIQLPTNDDTVVPPVSQFEKVHENSGFKTIHIVSEALPKIVPYVLINHREELLPLIMCAIECHPDSSVRDSLTHTLFNLIKRPDEQQRKIIMDACVNLARNVGEMRTETELLPQCWEQINHKYEERRLLVAQSCGLLAEFVHPEIRDSLILSIVQQLVEDSAAVVREAAAHNLALLLPLFPNADKYFKVEELMFQLGCDPSGLVVETTLRELVHAVVKWGNKLEHMLQILRSHILNSAQRCPPISGVDGSVDSHLRLLGEQERWNISVLLRMLSELLPYVQQTAIETCPFSSAVSALISPNNSEQEPCETSFFSKTLLDLYAGGHVEWPAFDWIYLDCFPDLIRLSCLLPVKEDNIRNQIIKFLLEVYDHYGKDYVTYIMLPVFLVAAGDDADLSLIPAAALSKINGLRPKTAVAERIAIVCVLPILLAGILGAPNRQEELAEYLRKLLLHKTMKDGSWSAYRTADLIDAVRFLCTRHEHHGIIFNILWEMVVSSNLDLKIDAANLLKVTVPYIDVKVASTHVLPALVTLGSDQNLNVKYASIDAFGAVAQHFRNDVIVDKIRVQMDAFLEDGSHEATIAVIRALVVAVPHTTDRLRDYLLSKIFQLTNSPAPGNRDRMNAFCEAVRALDATDIPANSVRDYLLPAIQNLLKDGDSLDPAHKEALEIILRERSGGTLESISKVMGMGAHLGITSSMTSFFGDGGLLGKKEPAIKETVPEPAISSPRQAASLQTTQEDTRFRRIMRGGFTDMFKRQTEEQ